MCLKVGTDYMALIKVVLANLNPWIFYISHPAMITAGMTLLMTMPVKAMVSAASMVVVGITRWDQIA